MLNLGNLVFFLFFLIDGVEGIIKERTSAVPEMRDERERESNEKITQEIEHV